MFNFKLDIKNILQTPVTKIILSIIWGLRLETLFQRICKDHNCIVLKGPDPNKIKKDPIEKTKVVESSDTPSLDKNESFTKLTRKDDLSENDRIQFENDNVVGSISLKGATIDYLTFKGYNVELNGNEKVTLLS